MGLKEFGGIMLWIMSGTFNQFSQLNLTYFDISYGSFLLLYYGREDAITFLLYYIFSDYGIARTRSKKDTCLLVQITQKTMISIGFIEILVLFVCNLHKRCVSLFLLAGWQSYPGYTFM